MASRVLFPCFVQLLAVMAQTVQTAGIKRPSRS
jgi:hypothetical protein